jgi:ribosomal protein S12 methylthiotransferase accessory factor
MVAIIGQGLLSDALAARLGPDWQVIAPSGEDPMDAAFTIMASDTAGSMAALLAHAENLPHPWLPVQGELNQVVIGPVVRRGVAGCPTCLARRRAAAAEGLKAHVELARHHGAAIARTTSPMLSSSACAIAAEIAADEAEAWGTDGSIRTVNAVIVLNLETLGLAVHRFLPDPLCSVCGGQPDDSR